VLQPTDCLSIWPSWSKAPVSGTGPKGRGFESHCWHFSFFGRETVVHNWEERTQKLWTHWNSNCRQTEEIWNCNVALRVAWTMKTLMRDSSVHSARWLENHYSWSCSWRSGNCNHECIARFMLPWMYWIGSQQRSGSTTRCYEFTFAIWQRRKWNRWCCCAAQNLIVCFKTAERWFGNPKYSLEINARTSKRGEWVICVGEWVSEWAHDQDINASLKNAIVDDRILWMLSSLLQWTQ
jgi:hypothetical protein